MVFAKLREVQASGYAEARARAHGGATALSDQLPRGRHRLSRDEVLASQLGRMLTAVAEAVAQKGFARVTVADVISRAGVSRETFYEHFSDKEDCFLRALDAEAEVLLARLSQAQAATPVSGPSRLENVLAAYLTELAAHPTLAQAFLVGAYGAGERATRRRIELQQRFVELTAAVLGLDPERDGPDWFICEALVAAISSLVTTRVATGRATELPGLQAPLLALARRMLPPVLQSQFDTVREDS